MPLVLDGPTEGFREQPIMSNLDTGPRQRGRLTVFRMLEYVKHSAREIYFLGVPDRDYVTSIKVSKEK